MSAVGSGNAVVLVVDDERDIRDLVSLRLERAGYEVLVAGDGIEALDLVRTARPDLLVLDARMPRMDGFELTRTLKADAGTRRIPVLLLSASVQPDEVDAGLDAGADDYLRKPFRPADLLARVAALLEAAAAAEG